MANGYQLNVTANANALDSSIKSVTTKNTYKITIDADGKQIDKKLISSLKTTQDTAGNVTREFTKLNQTTGKWSTTLTESSKQVNSSLKQVDSATKNVNSSLKSTADVSKKVGQSFLDISKKVAKFYLATVPIQMVQRALEDATNTVKDFDNALTDFKKVSDLSGESLQQYTEELGNLGDAVARTTTQMVQSATEFKKSGYSDEDSARLARIAEEYKNIADAELSSSESAGFIISQMKAYGDETESFAQHTIDAVNNISNNMAVSSSDVSEGLTKSAAGMSALGNSFEETASLVASGSEIMTNQASRVSRGLMTIGNNIAKLAQASDTMTIATKNGAKSIELINSETGDLNSTYKVLEQISSAWGDMSKEQQTNLAITLAGKNQFAVFNSVVSNFADAQKSLTLALNSAGSAEAENAKYLDSLQGKMAQLQQQFNKLVLGDGGLQNFAKKLIDVGTAILKFANSDIGQLIIKLGFLFGVIKGGIALFTALKTTSIGVSVQLAIMTAESIGLGAAIDVLTASMLANPLFWGAIAVAGIVAFAVVIDKFSDSLENNQKKLESLKSEYEDAKQSVSNTATQLSEVRDRINEINSMEGAKVTREGELSELERQEAKLSSILAIEQERERIAKQDYEKQAKKTVYKEISETSGSSGGGIVGGVGYTNIVTGEREQNSIQKDRVQILKDVSEQMLKQGEIISRLNAKKQRQGELNEYEQKQLNNAVDAYDRATAVGSKYSEELENETEELGTTSKTRAYAQEGLDAYGDAITKTTKDVQEANGVIVDNSDALDGNADADENAENEASALDEAIKKLNDSLTDYSNTIKDLGSIENNFKTLNDAIAEYNKENGFSLDTMSDLLSLGDEYINLLEFENGKVELNKKASKELANAKIDEAEASAYNKAMAELEALAQQELGNTYKTNLVPAEQTKTAIQNLGDSALQSAKDAITSADSWNTFWQSATNSKGVNTNNSEAKAKADEIGETLKNTIQILEEQRKGIGKVTNATSNNTNATSDNTKKTKENTDAVKKNTEALKDRINTYSKALDYAIDKLNEDIDKLNAKQDKALEKIINSAKKIVGTYEGNKNEIDKMMDDLTEEHLDAISDIQDKLDDLYNDYKDNISDINKQIEDASKDFQDEINDIDEKIIELEKDMEIDNLTKQKDEINSYYENLISNIENANTALEEQIALQKAEEALAKSKASKVMVYKDGAWQYTTNQSEVQSAQLSYDEIKREQEKTQKINALREEQKIKVEELETKIKELEDAGKKSYKQQIEDLRESRKNADKEYNNKVEALIKQRSEIQRQYELQHQDLVNANIAEENAYQEKLTKLENLSQVYDEIKSKYEEQITPLEKLRKKLENIKDTISEIENKKAFTDVFKINADEISKNWDNFSTKLNKFVKDYNSAIAKMNKIEVTSTTKTTSTKTKKVNAHASGIASVENDEIALVGDNPNNREIVLGSQVNGTLTKLDSGSGVVNAKSTRTLAGILNQLGSLNGIGGNTFSTNTNTSSVTKIEIGNISLPNVSNGKGFVDYLQNFSLDMMQQSYAR